MGKLKLQQGPLDSWFRGTNHYAISSQMLVRVRVTGGKSSCSHADSQTLSQTFWFHRSRVRCRCTTFKWRAAIYDTVLGKCQKIFNIWLKKTSMHIMKRNQSYENYLNVLRREDNPGTEQSKVWKWLHLFIKRLTLGCKVNYKCLEYKVHLSLSMFVQN